MLGPSWSTRQNLNALTRSSGTAASRGSRRRCFSRSQIPARWGSMGALSSSAWHVYQGTRRTSRRASAALRSFWSGSQQRWPTTCGRCGAATRPTTGGATRATPAACRCQPNAEATCSSSKAAAQCAMRASTSRTGATSTSVWGGTAPPDVSQTKGGRRSREGPLTAADSRHRRCVMCPGTRRTCTMARCRHSEPSSNSTIVVAMRTRGALSVSAR